MLRVLALLLLSALSPVLVACGSDDAGTSSRASTSAASEKAAASASASGPASSSPLPSNPSPSSPTPSNPTPLDLSGAKLAGFTADDGVISCLFGSVGRAPTVRCDVPGSTWSVPDKPQDCTGDWGTAAGLTAGGAGELLCISDTVVGIPNQTDGTRELPPGTLATYGQLACLIQDTGVSCYDTSSGEHSLFVTLHTYEVI